MWVGIFRSVNIGFVCLIVSMCVCECVLCVLGVGSLEPVCKSALLWWWMLDAF